MRTNKLLVRGSLVLVFSIMTALSSAEAAPRLRGLGVQDLGVSAGIAAPSSSGAVFQNPAGLVYNHGARLSLQGGVEDSTDARLFSGGLAYGAPSVALAAGVLQDQHFFIDDLSAAYYGLAVYAHSLRMAIGFSGTTAISPSSQGTNLNVGVLFFPYERFRLGLKADGIIEDGGPTLWGAGMAYEADRSFHLVADVTTDPNFDRYLLEPGIWLGSDQLSATLTYGASVNTLADNEIDGQGFSGGVSARLGRGVSLQMYYKQMTKYYASLTFDL